MEKSSKSKVIIQDIAGCGKFQIIITFCVYFIGNSCSAFTMMFMAFGNFNPGWKCLHQNSTVLTNETLSNAYNDLSMNDATRVIIETTKNFISQNESENHNKTSEKIVPNSCSVFESCDHIEFDPESSTIVSEWGLVCDKKWIPSMIISIQMIGVLVGSLFAGYLGDAFGRKKTIYTALFLMTCFNAASIFSKSWEIFAVLRFFLGLSSSCVISLYCVFTAEFVPTKWRSFLIGLPAWNLSCVFFGIACMYFRQWRYVLAVTAVIGALGLIPALWIPESLRWLEVKNEVNRFEQAAKRVTKMNGKILPTMEELGIMATQKIDVTESAKKHNVLHLFKRGYRKLTLILIVPWFSMSLVNYALGFGVKALHGNFYLNLIISNVVDIPFAIFPIILPNILGRKPTVLIFIAGASICLLGASALDRLAPDSVRGTGIAVLFFTGIVFIDGMWCVMATLGVEIYPTVIRGLGISWCFFVARTAGVIAPFLIPDDKNNVFISFTTMGVLLLVCCGFALKLPETKGKPLRDTFENDREETGC